MGKNSRWSPTLKELTKENKHTNLPRVIEDLRHHTLGARLRKLSRPSTPSDAISTCRPSASKSRCKVRCIGRLSSTTRTVSIDSCSSDVPQATSLSGSYKFQQANLSVFHGIAGTLSSDGDFGGQLGDVAVRGEVDIPDFKVVTSDHEVHLNSRFRANVNGTNGDIFLKEIETSYLQTVVGGAGSVASKSGQKGKTTSLELELEVNTGRIQDLLRLFVAANRPPMNGQTRLKAHVVIPPEGRPFLKELILQGDFEIDEAGFTKPTTQTRVDELSERARGEKKDKDKDKDKNRNKDKDEDKNDGKNKKASESDADDPENVVLNLRGHAEVRDGVARFLDLSFNAPGASARMSGTYNLLNEQIDLHGTLKTEARLSQDTSGIKSVLLKPFDPLFKGKKGGAEVPVKITGTYQNPQFGFDVLE
jgi:hypothetical protein